MQDLIWVAAGFTVPLIGTTLGAAAALFLRGRLSPRLHRCMLGFASGVMLAALVWSLLLPAIEFSVQAGTPAWLPSSGGFFFGVVGLLALERLVQSLRRRSDCGAEIPCDGERTRLLALSVTLHNVPEGMAVGVGFAGALNGDTGTLAAAFALALGIAIQNIPEGSIISMPLAISGEKKGKAFFYGFLSGAVEPAASVLTLLFTGLVRSVLPYILSLAAGAMFAVVVKELIPEAEGCGDTDAAIAAAGGFAVMMLLDVALG